MEKRKLRIGLCLPLTLIGAAACNGPSSQDVELESTRSALTPHDERCSDAVRRSRRYLCRSRRRRPSSGKLRRRRGDIHFNGSALQTTSGQCVDIQFGNLAAGVIDVTTCNGTVNQKWSVASGEITSANTSDGQSHCLDVHFGSHGVGTQLDLAGCNGHRCAGILDDRLHDGHREHLHPQQRECVRVPRCPFRFRASRNVPRRFAVQCHERAVVRPRYGPPHTSGEQHQSLRGIQRARSERAGTCRSRNMQQQRRDSTVVLCQQEHSGRRCQYREHVIRLSRCARWQPRQRNDCRRLHV